MAYLIKMAGKDSEQALLCQGDFHVHGPHTGRQALIVLVKLTSVFCLITFDQLVSSLVNAFI